VQSTGDGIFALFGAPVAHEDHPQRALHAALATRDELRRRGEELRTGGPQFPRTHASICPSGAANFSRTEMSSPRKAKVKERISNIVSYVESIQEK
jgi:hypothetical protein